MTEKEKIELEELLEQCANQRKLTYRLYLSLAKVDDSSYDETFESWQRENAKFGKMHAELRKKIEAYEAKEKAKDPYPIGGKTFFEKVKQLLRDIIDSLFAAYRTVRHER